MSVLAIGAAALVGGALPWRCRITRWLRGLIEWEDDERRLVVGDRTTLVAMSGIGALGMCAYFILGGHTGGVSAPPGGGGGSDEGVTTPVVDVVVVDTSTWYVLLDDFESTAEGDTQDSLQIQVDRVGANFSSPLTNAVSQTANLRDTISDNADWKADSLYVVRARRFSTILDVWSAYDSVEVINNPVTATMVFATEWDTGTGTGSGITRDTARTRHWTSRSGTLDSVKVSATAGRAFPTENFLENRVSSVSSISQLNFDPGDNFIPSVQVGEVVTVRAWVSVVATALNEPDLSSHPFYFHAGDGQYTSSPLAIDFGYDGAGGYTSTSDFNITTRSFGGGIENMWGDGAGASCCDLTGIARDAIYEVMARYYRSDTDKWQREIRVYTTAAGVRSTIHHAENSFHALGAVGSWDPATLLTDAIFDDNDDGAASHMRGFRLGRESPDAGSSGANHAVMQFAAFRIDHGTLAAVPWPVPEYSAAEKAWEP